MNKDIMKQLGFSDEVNRFENKKCVFCSEHINLDSFRNDISKREYKISGQCQKCQDDLFGID